MKNTNFFLIFYYILYKTIIISNYQTNQIVNKNNLSIISIILTNYIHNFSNFNYYLSNKII